jgi:hypothetical protein
LTGALIWMMVFFGIAVQAIVVYKRIRHRSAGEIAKELLIVLSFFKPVIDLRRLRVREAYGHSSGELWLGGASRVPGGSGRSDP